MPPSPFPPPFAELLLLGTKSYGVEDNFGQFGSAVLSGFPPSLSPTYSLLTVAGREWGGRENALTLCKYCSAIAKTLVCYQHF